MYSKMNQLYVPIYSLFFRFSKHPSKCFTHMNSFVLIISLWEKLLLFPFYRWEDWGVEKLNNPLRWQVYSCPQAARLQGRSYQWRQPVALQNTESRVLTLPILSHSHEVCLRNSYGLCWWFSGKESTCQCRIYRFDLWVRKSPWRRKWQPTPVFLPGKSHQQRSLVGYSPWGCKRVRHDSVTAQKQQEIHMVSKLLVLT